MLNNLKLNKTKWNDLKWTETTFKDIERLKKQLYYVNCLKRLKKTLNGLKTDIITKMRSLNVLKLPKAFQGYRKLLYKQPSRLP